MYPIALDCGIACGKFWEMSLDEILDVLESHVRKEERKAKEELRKLHFLARDTAHQLGFLIAGKEDDSPPELWDYFPELFAEEKDMADKKKTEQALAVYKAQMMDFMYSHNHMRNGGEN